MTKWIIENRTGEDDLTVIVFAEGAFRALEDYDVRPVDGIVLSRDEAWMAYCKQLESGTRKAVVQINKSNKNND